MGWDGAGGYTRQKNFSADASAGVKILASGMDTELDDFASAMTNALSRDGQNTPVSTLPMGGNRHVNVGAATSVENYLRANELITQTPILVRGKMVGTICSVSAEFFTTVSTNQAPPDGSILVVKASGVLTVSADIVLHTPTGNKSSRITVGAGEAATSSRAIHGRQMLGSRPHILFYNSAASSYELVNPFRGAHQFTGVIKGRNALGTLTGTGPSITCYMNLDGDVLTIGNGTISSVSVSVSTLKFELSGTPGVLADSVLGNLTNDTIQIERSSGRTQLYCEVILNGSGQLEYRDIHLAGDVAIFSADETFNVPAHTITLFIQAA